MLATCILSAHTHTQSKCILSATHTHTLSPSASQDTYTQPKCILSHINNFYVFPPTELPSLPKIKNGLPKGHCLLYSMQNLQMETLVAKTVIQAAETNSSNIKGEPLLEKKLKLKL